MPHETNLPVGTGVRYSMSLGRRLAQHEHIDPVRELDHMLLAFLRELTDRVENAEARSTLNAMVEEVGHYVLGERKKEGVIMGGGGARPQQQGQRQQQQGQQGGGDRIMAARRNIAGLPNHLRRTINTVLSRIQVPEQRDFIMDILGGLTPQGLRNVADDLVRQGANADIINYFSLGEQPFVDQTRAATGQSNLQKTMRLMARLDQTVKPGIVEVQTQLSTPEHHAAFCERMAALYGDGTVQDFEEANATLGLVATNSLPERLQFFGIAPEHHEESKPVRFVHGMLNAWRGERVTEQQVEEARRSADAAWDRLRSM